jgi:hypothetical protein
VVLVYFGQFLKIAEVAHIFGLIFPMYIKVMYWATFGRFVSQTHLRPVFKTWTMILLAKVSKFWTIDF